MKICSRCYRELPDEMFYHEKGQCRECRSEIRLFNWRKAQLQMKKNTRKFQPSTDVLRLAKAILENELEKRKIIDTYDEFLKEINNEK